jgi:Spx/MgsR family transcriptional regulator
MPKTKPKIRFLQKPSCTSCRKARALLEKSGAELEFRNLDKERLNAAEIDALIGARDYIPFLNTRNELYRRKEMSAHPPSRADAIRLMAGEPNLIRRPVVIRGNALVLGCDEKALKELLK